MALNSIPEDDDRRTKSKKIRASIENVVHALLRVSAMNKRLAEIFQPVAMGENEIEKENERKRTGSGPPPEEGNIFCLLGLEVVMSTTLQFIKGNQSGLYLGNLWSSIA